LGSWLNTRQKFLKTDKLFFKPLVFLSRRKNKEQKLNSKSFIYYMIERTDSDITQILKDWNNGNEEAKELLIPYVYQELKRQAHILMSRERPNHTLQTTALVHEAFMKLSEQSGVDWQNRSHFFGIASRLMRRILIDHARMYMREKRGNKPIFFSLDDVQIPIEQRADSILALDEILEKLEKFDKKQAKIVEMRFFGGLTNAEIAESLGISERTVMREWQAAKLWLAREMKQI
jgi:RNA polymerase sigma-70 factor (ECF subfamily)